MAAGLIPLFISLLMLYLWIICTDESFFSTYSLVLCSFLSTSHRCVQGKSNQWAKIPLAMISAYQANGYPASSIISNSFAYSYVFLTLAFWDPLKEDAENWSWNPACKSIWCALPLSYGPTADGKANRTLYWLVYLLWFRGICKIDAWRDLKTVRCLGMCFD